MWWKPYVCSRSWTFCVRLTQHPLSKWMKGYIVVLEAFWWQYVTNAPPVRRSGTPPQCLSSTWVSPTSCSAVSTCLWLPPRSGNAPGVMANCCANYSLWPATALWLCRSSQSWPSLLTATWWLDTPDSTPSKYSFVLFVTVYNPVNLVTGSAELFQRCEQTLVLLPRMFLSSHIYK